MQAKISTVKGMSDILPDSAQTHNLPPISLWHLLEDAIYKLMHSYCYEEIRLPIVERTALFERSIGKVTDIVEKEMYTFIDGDESLTLRPEGTASCVRACIEHGLIRNQQLQRLWYFGPMFRHEQPQYGRYRQFYQFGVEAFGLEGPCIDAEQISMVANLWNKLNIAKYIELEVNSLGSSDTRKAFTQDLVAYFAKYENQLDEDSKRRLHKNPLRILDSKNKDMQDLIQAAPKLLDYLTKEDQQHFEDFLGLLQSLNIKYKINSRLVRGLDYYNKTVYEWVTNELGAQGTVCAGGRYNGLAEQLGGPSTPAVGFSMGVERVLTLLSKLNNNITKKINGYLINVGNLAFKQALLIAEKIRVECKEFALLINYSGGSFKSQFKKADKSGAELALIIGEDELNNGTITIKFLRQDRPQETISIANVISYLEAYYGSISN